MSAFRKRAKLVDRPSPGSVTFGQAAVSTSKEVLHKGSRVPVTLVEVTQCDITELSETLQMPKDEDYKLETMLRNGIVPEEVPVTGILDSPDPLDLSNQGVSDAMFRTLSEQVGDKKPVEAVSEPVAVVSPTAPDTQPTE